MKSNFFEEVLSPGNSGQESVKVIQYAAIDKTIYHFVRNLMYGSIYYYLKLD